MPDPPMPVTLPDIDPIAADLSGQIAAAADAALSQLLRLIEQGTPPGAATSQVLAAFEGPYAAALAAAFSAALQTAATPASVLALPVGDITLSDRLYRHQRQTAQEVTAIVRSHAQGLQQARALARALYDGYNPQDGIRRPLEGAARAQLPKALRELTATTADRQELGRLYAQMQQQAARLKSPALQAAYLQTLHAWAKGKGREVLTKRLQVAVREKTRHMAERIAQTELARAYTAKVAQQIMQDQTVEVVQVRLNPRHPTPDICDLHARADLFGLGPGLYPKARAPRPPFHPFCWCKLVTRPDVSAAQASEREEDQEAAARAWLRSLPPAQAARVLGSRERLGAVLGGARWEKVTQGAVRADYRLARVGDGVTSGAADNGRMDAYEIAKMPGGAHHGMLLNIRKNLGVNQLRSGIAKIEKQIQDHKLWIVDPGSKPGVMSHPREDVDRWVKEKWPSDIARLTEQRVIYQAVLLEKEKQNGNSPSRS